MTLIKKFNRPPNIILIDDNDIDLFIHQKLIKFVNPNCRITNFSSGRDTLDYLKLILANNIQNIPDFILLDLNMPLFNGFDFLEEFELITLHIKDKPEILIVTCSINPEEKTKCFRYNSVTKFIQKPLAREAITDFLTQNGFSLN